MCDQTMPYTPGTWVWAKVVNRIWWPGKIVDFDSVPEALDYYKNKRNSKTAVHFERDNSYEIIVNLDKVCLYSCPKKMEFIEKGFLLYVRQNKKEGSKISGFDMNNFIEDVKNVEKAIGGDINIFDDFIKKQENEEKIKPPPIYIKELFISDKERQKKAKEEKRRSLSLTANKPKVTNENTPLQKSRKTISKMPAVPQCFVCAFCGVFSTNRYDNLKRHMDAHKNGSLGIRNEETPNKNTKVTKKSSKNKKTASSTNTPSPQAQSSTSNKHKYTKSKITESKKVKIQDELSMDWDDENLDETESIIQLKEEYIDNDSEQNKESDIANHGNEDQSSNPDNELNSLGSAGKEFSENKVHNESNNVKKYVEGLQTQMENVTIDIKMETVNIDNKLLENNKTQDKVDAQLKQNNEDFLGISCEPLEKVDWEKLTSKDEHGEGFLYVDNLKVLLADPYPDYLKEDVPNPENIKLQPFVTEVSPPKLENDVMFSILEFDDSPPVKTDEELKSSENRKQFIEIAAKDNGKVTMNIPLNAICKRIYPTFNLPF